MPHGSSNTHDLGGGVGGLGTTVVCTIGQAILHKMESGPEIESHTSEAFNIVRVREATRETNSTQTNSQKIGKEGKAGWSTCNTADDQCHCVTCFCCSRVSVFMRSGGGKMQFCGSG